MFSTIISRYQNVTSQSISDSWHTNANGERGSTEILNIQIFNEVCQIYISYNLLLVQIYHNRDELFYYLQLGL